MMLIVFIDFCIAHKVTTSEEHLAGNGCQIGRSEKHFLIPAGLLSVASILRVANETISLHPISAFVCYFWHCFRSSTQLFEISLDLPCALCIRAFERSEASYGTASNFKQLFDWSHCNKLQEYVREIFDCSWAAVFKEGRFANIGAKPWQDWVDLCCYRCCNPFS